MYNANAVRDADPSYSASIGQPLDLKGLADVFQRRWKIFFAVTAAVVILAAGTALVLRPIYDASTDIRIDPTEKSAVDFEAAARGAPPDQALVDTEVKIMQSREVARSVVQSLNLVNDGEFNRHLNQTRTNADRRQPPVADLVTDSIQKHLDVVREGSTYIVAIHFRSLNAAKAANIANAFARAYLQASIEAKVRSAVQQSAWYSQRMSSVSAAAQQADTNLAQFKAANGIVDASGGDTVAQQQIGTVTEQLANAEASAAAARTNAQAAKAQIAQGGLDSVSSVLNSPTIIEMRRQRADLLRSRDEVSSRYGPKHPETLKVTQQVEGLEQQIRDESQRIVSGLESDARAAEAKVASLRGGLTTLKGELATNSRASVQADTLKREADARNAMMSQLAASAQQSEQQQHVNQSQATIVALASVPTKAAFPSVPLFASLGLALGLIAGVGATVASETLDPGVRTAEAVERELGVPFIAFSPLIPPRLLKVDGGDIQPWDYVVAKPMSAYAEALRTARTAIKLSDLDRQFKVVAITSALPAEGKTVCSVSLARVMAMSGERVLLIDCDLRRNALKGLLPNPSAAGLVEVLMGTAPLGSVITPDVVAGLDVLPLHKAAFTPRDMFGTAAMRDLLHSLKDHYDHIVLDGPPVLAVNDARTLATLADVVLMIVHWGTTPKPAVQAALDQLKHDKAPIAGVLLTMVDTRSSLASGAAGSSYYSGRYARYYQD